MDAIRKKMQSLKSETDSLYSIIHNFEEETVVPFPWRNGAALTTAQIAPREKPGFLNFATAKSVSAGFERTSNATPQRRLRQRPREGCGGGRIWPRRRF